MLRTRREKAQGTRNSFVIRRSSSDLPEMHLKCIGCFHCISVSSCVMSTCAETLQFVWSLAVAVPFLAQVCQRKRHKLTLRFSHGKVLTNDMYLTSVTGVLKLTRSIKALFPKWEEHPWQLEGTIGNRIAATLRGATKMLDDEMGEDPLEDVEEDVVPQTPTPDFVPLQLRGGMRPPPPSAVVSDADGSRPEGSVQELLSVEHQAQGPERAEESPSLGFSGPMTPMEMLIPAAEHVNMDVEESAEPSAKRQKLSVMRTGDEDLCHMDIDNDEYLQDGGAQFSEFANDFATVDGEMSDFEEPQQAEMSEDGLRQPFSQSEPELAGERLQAIDDFADSVEI